MLSILSFFKGEGVIGRSRNGTGFVENRVERREFKLDEIEQLGYHDLLKEYEYCRNNNIKELTLLYGSTLLLKYSRKLGEYRWEVMEGMLLSTFEFGVKEEQALQVASTDKGGRVSDRLLKWQKYCFNELSKKHGSTFRFKKLVGMLFESKGEYEKAIEIYKKLIRFDPEDLSLRMRLVNVLHHKVPDLIDDHIKECIMDVNAWKFKAYHLLTDSGGNIDYKNALYCMEELLLHEPQNLDIINTIADIYLALGDATNARKYFCLALNIRSTGIRALWGVLQSEIVSKTTSNGSFHSHYKGLNKTGKGSSKKKSGGSDSDIGKSKSDSTQTRLSELAIKKLIDIYSGIENKDKKLSKPETIVITPSMVASRLIDHYSNKIRSQIN